jgi:hypothetical protein
MNCWKRTKRTICGSRPAFQKMDNLLGAVIAVPRSRSIGARRNGKSKRQEAEEGYASGPMKLSVLICCGHGILDDLRKFERPPLSAG